MDGRRDGWKWFKGVRRKKPLNFYYPNGKRAFCFLRFFGFINFPFSVNVFCDFTYNPVGTQIIHRKIL